MSVNVILASIFKVGARQELINIRGWQGSLIESNDLGHENLSPFLINADLFTMDSFIVEALC